MRSVSAVLAREAPQIDMRLMTLLVADQYTKKQGQRIGKIVRLCQVDMPIPRRASARLRSVPLERHPSSFHGLPAQCRVARAEGTTALCFRRRTDLTSILRLAMPGNTSPDRVGKVVKPGSANSNWHETC